MIRRLPVLLVLVGLMPLPAVGAEPSPAEVQDGGLAVLREAEAWADKCPDWLDPAHTLAIRMKRTERQAVMDIAGTPELRERSGKLADQRQAEVARLGCQAPAAPEIRTRVRQLAFETRAELTSRAVAFAEAPGGAWLAALTDLPRLRHLLGEAVRPYDVLMAKAGVAEAWQRMRAAHRAEAETLLALACSHRRALGNGEYECPPVPEHADNEAALADAILGSAEGYALGYERIRLESRP